MADLQPAMRIGRYQLVSAIGAGGMGRVWVALDTAAPGLRLVALKTALSDVDASLGSDFWATLADEAALASRIDHPNVCATFELGEERSVHFMVMEWSDGASLRDLLDAAPDRRISSELAAFIAAKVAAGLHAAHELRDADGTLLGVVHRDVSPQNVLLSLGGQVRLADFGVAKARGQQHRPTQTGEVKGKLSYMAPEQITSKTIDRRADVFALGCIVYEAALGVRPFHGDDPLATMYKLLEQEVVAPRAVDPSFPVALEAIVLKALAKDASKRYQTAEELQQALFEYLSTLRRPFADKHVAEIISSSLGDKLRRRNRAILASAEQLRRGELDPARLDSPAPEAPMRTLTPEGGVERSVSLPRTARHVHLAGLRGIVAGMLVTLAGFGAWRYATPVATPPAPSVLPAAAAAPVVTTARPVAAPPAPEPEPPAPPAVASEPASPSSPKALATARRPRAANGTAAAAGAAKSKPSAKKPRPIDRDNPFATEP